MFQEEQIATALLKRSQGQRNLLKEVAIQHQVKRILFLPQVAGKKTQRGA